MSGLFTPAGESNGYSYQGMFGRVIGQSSTNLATISNIGVMDSFVQGHQYVGGVVGNAAGNSAIKNCYNTGSVEGSGNYVGGVVGGAGINTAVVENCYNTGSVNASGNHVGGIVGIGSATNCYNTGPVSSASDSVGGVVGFTQSGNTVANCYNTGSVEGYSDVGGVVGSASGSKSTVTNCYNTGSVSGSSSVGGVVGRASSSSTVENCYNAGSVNASGDYVGGVVGEAWSSSSSSCTIINCYNTGSVSGSKSRVGGVVGYASSSSSSSCTITNCYNTGSVEGYRDVGGAVGYASIKSTVTNCYNTGSVSGGDDVGGVVGYVRDSTVANCYNIGSVIGSGDHVGGVAGNTYSDNTIKNCYNTGSVNASGDHVGGVVGWAIGDTVINCYNTGSVSGSNFVGGVVGWASDSTISNTYYGGDCTLDVGIGEGSGSAVKIDKPVEEWAKNKEWYSANAINSDGSLVWSADSPWDFENVWEFVENAPDCAANNGYLMLQGVGGNSQVIYWTDEAVWSAAGKDFNNYTLSGSGSPGAPYLIQSEWDLAYLSWTIYTDNPIEASHVSSAYYYSGIYFEQTADLDLSAYYWQPIGIVFLRDGTSANRRFSGCYDGGSHTVSGVFTPAGEGNGYNYQGLFGNVRGSSSTSKAAISNVGVIDSFVQGYEDVGGVVVYAGGNSTVENCYNTGSVNASSNYVGGVVGYISNSSTITNCYNTGSVEGSGYYVGGVVGNAGGKSTVENCYNTGSVSGLGYVGGVAGHAYSFGSSSCTITNCYNTGSVSASDYAGGVLGNAYSGSTIKNCFNTGSVSGSRQVGGVVGNGYSNSAISNTYYGGNCTLNKGIGLGSGSAVKIDKPVEEWAKNQDWYSADAVNSDGSLVWSADSPWDFENTWKIVRAPDYIPTNDGYPVLQSFVVDFSQIIYWTDEAVWSAAGKDFNNYTLSGSGSQDDPYLIQSEWDLAYLSWTIYTNHPIEVSHASGSYYYSGIYFEQTADLDLSAYYWKPIGIGYLRDVAYILSYFSGCYDGGSHTVSGVFTPAGSSHGYSYQGLFGHVYGRSSTNLASISNVGVIDSFVQGDRYVGGVVGNAADNSTVTNCYNAGSVEGYSDVGGVAGAADSNSTVVESCYNTGSVSGSISSVGGVVGSANGTISNCYNTGSVVSLLKTYSYIGGIVGSARKGCTVTNCYNTGSVEGYSDVGGVVGFTYAIVENCYNTGSVSGEEFVGGIVGTVSDSAAVTNCGFEGVINGSSSVGAIVGDIYVAPATISNCYAVAESDSEISLVGSNSGNGTIENIVGIITSGGTSKKVYTGSDFSGFAWLNFDSSPVPKGLSLAGQFQEPPAEYAGNSNWILTKMQSEGWSAI